MKTIYKILLFLLLTTPCLAKLNIVTTLPVFASIAKSVGGSQVEVSALSTGRKNPHHLTARPSFVLKMSRADIFIEAGLDLEKAWTQPLLAGAGNPKILPGRSGYVFAYRGIRLAEVPSTRVDRSWGDIHIYGNPHYWLDPVNGIIIARNIRNTLKKLDPQNSVLYNNNFNIFSRDIKQLAITYLHKFKPFFGSRIVVHHREWVYLSRRFRLRETGSIEEKLGIEPSMGYIHKLLQTLKISRPQLILLATYNPVKYSRYLSKKLGIPYLVLDTDVVDEIDTRGYYRLLEKVLSRILSKLHS